MYFKCKIVFCSLYLVGLIKMVVICIKIEKCSVFLHLKNDMHDSCMHASLHLWEDGVLSTFPCLSKKHGKGKTDVSCFIMSCPDNKSCSTKTNVKVTARSPACKKKKMFLLKGRYV